MNYFNKIKVRQQSGKFISLEEWQKLYELPIGSRKIGKYFEYTESRFIQDIEAFDCLIVDGFLMMVLDEYRKLKHAPVRINSFNRTEEYQKKLQERGFKAAKNSPHVQCMAADIDTDSYSDTLMQVQILEKAAKKMGITIRLGYTKYLQNYQTFIHVDVCPMYFAEGKLMHDIPHPKAWEVPARW